MTRSTTEATRFRAVLLDFDGTVVDTIELILASYRHTLTVHHGASPPDRVFLKDVGKPLRTQLGLFARDEAELEAMFQTYITHSRDHHDALARTFDGVFEVLDRLHGKIPIGLVTSKARVGVDRGFVRFGLGHFFDAVVTADDVVEHKPSPTPVLEAASRLGVDAGECVMVGDSPHDMAAGRAAGATTAAAGWGAFDPPALRACRPDLWLDEPAELEAVVFGP